MVSENKVIEVCSECLRACCWYGEFMCLESKGAATTKKTVGELRLLSIENESYWSDEKMHLVYGDKNPFEGK